MGNDLPRLYARIGELLERSPGEASSRELWAEVEDVLSEGYAHVLALESRRLRHRQRAEELAQVGGNGERAAQVRSLLQLAASLGDELRRLRSLLTAVRAHSGRVERAAARFAAR